MNASFQAIQIEKSKALRDQIRTGIRDLILSRKLVPGEQIPSVRELARLWGANVGTVHVALTALEREGLLLQAHGKGTFVRKREERLVCVGIYHDELSFGSGKSLYLQSLHAALKKELKQRGIETDVWIDPRPAEEGSRPWPEFVRAAERREFQALIVPGTDLPHLRWQTKLPVPTSFLGAPGVPAQVGFDLAQFAEFSLRALAKQGCRSVGLITTMYTDVRPGGSPNPNAAFFQRFTDVSRDLGLSLKSAWMRVCRHDGDLRGRSAESYGYEQFLQLWSRTERPDGLVVHDDVAARGVILGLQQKQVRVPQELKLVLHKNESIELLCPMPATFLVNSERETARALIEQVRKQFRGERCEPVALRFRLMAHNAYRS